MQQVTDELGIETLFYMALADEAKAYYEIYLETRDVLSIETSDLAEKVENRIRELNVEYERKRASGRLKKLKISRVKIGTKEALKSYYVAKGVRENQFKFLLIQYRKEFNFPMGIYSKHVRFIMKKIKMTCCHLKIPFHVSFKHASAERNMSDSVLVVAEFNDIRGYGEGCPRPYVTGESYQSAEDFFKTYSQSIIENIDDLKSLHGWIKKQQASIDKNPAAWCAIELALLDLMDN